MKTRFCFQNALFRTITLFVWDSVTTDSDNPLEFPKYKKIILVGGKRFFISKE